MRYKTGGHIVEIKMRYKIGGHIVEINVAEEAPKAYGIAGGEFLTTLLPSFTPFVSQEKGTPLMRLTIVGNMKEERDAYLIRDVDTGNGMTRVDRLPDGGYQFMIRDIEAHKCALLHTTENFSDCKVALKGTLNTMRFALNNAMMLSYAFSSAYHDTLLIHASVVRYKDKTYAFTAKSGTGKSTQVANWLNNIPGCDLINDDNPIVRLEYDPSDTEKKRPMPILYGSPWSGKTPCYRNVKTSLGAIVQIKRDNHNEVLPQSPLKAFTTVLSACSAMKWDEKLYSHVCKTVSGFVENVQVAELHCLPDADSAITACNYLTKS